MYSPPIVTAFNKESIPYLIGVNLFQKKKKITVPIPYKIRNWFSPFQMEIIQFQGSLKQKQT
jgi:hypothetical protein